MSDDSAKIYDFGDLFGAFAVGLVAGLLLIAFACFTSTDAEFWSYTKAIGTCDSTKDACAYFDVYVQCQGDKVLNITPMDSFIMTKFSAEHGITTWCKRI